MKYIYIAGPLSKGDQAANIRIAIHHANLCLRYGLIPFLPHLTWFWHLVTPKEYEEWLSLDDAWLQKCDAVFRIAGESAGVDREVARARELGLPVFTDPQELFEWATGKATTGIGSALP